MLGSEFDLIFKRNELEYAVQLCFERLITLVEEIDCILTI